MLKIDRNPNILVIEIKPSLKKDAIYIINL